MEKTCLMFVPRGDYRYRCFSALSKRRGMRPRMQAGLRMRCGGGAAARQRARHRESCSGARHETVTDTRWQNQRECANKRLYIYIYIHPSPCRQGCCQTGPYGDLPRRYCAATQYYYHSNAAVAACKLLPPASRSTCAFLFLALFAAASASLPAFTAPNHTHSLRASAPQRGPCSKPSPIARSPL